jgi:hypothetical protein
MVSIQAVKTLTISPVLSVPLFCGSATLHMSGFLNSTPVIITEKNKIP